MEEALGWYVSKQISQDEEEERDSIEGMRCDDRERRWVLVSREVIRRR